MSAPPLWSVTSSHHLGAMPVLIKILIRNLETHRIVAESYLTQALQTFPKPVPPRVNFVMHMAALNKPCIAWSLYSPN